MGLAQQNVAQSMNDKQIDAVFSKYNLYQHPALQCCK